MSSSEAMVKTMLRQRRGEFMYEEGVKIWAGTWNVNGSRPEDDLLTWFDFTIDTNGVLEKVQPDIVVVGFQELDLSAEALLFGGKGRTQMWLDHLLAILRSKGPYVQVESKQLVGILLAVYCLHPLLDKISYVSSDHVTTGIMGVLGNKGGVGIRFQVHETTICIVNSHLNAHESGVSRRNHDYQEIGRKMRFEDMGLVGCYQSVMKKQSKVYMVWDHDILLWMGDLNYRIEMERKRVIKHVLSRRYDELLARDQLREQMRVKAAFECFKESEITFAPTYKYDVGSMHYDTSDKQRTPSYTDRILTRIGDPVEMVSYERKELLSSDHRPVFGMLTARVRAVEWEQYEEVRREVIMEADRRENELRPDVDVFPLSVVYERVRYSEPATQQITVTNISPVVTRIRFIQRADGTVSAPWLWINPVHCQLKPQASVDINLSIIVKDHMAYEFNSGQRQLEDILILHVEDGKDIFVSVSGDYLRTCFGWPLDELARMPNPVRLHCTTDTDTSLSVPKELWQLLNYFGEAQLKQAGLFVQCGEVSEVESIREMLDLGTPIKESYVGSPLAVGECLLRFLESLYVPVVSCTVLKAAKQGGWTYEGCKKAMVYMPPAHYRVLIYVVTFLREVLEWADDNQTNAPQLAGTFAKVMCKEAVEEKGGSDDPYIACAQFLRVLIQGL